MHSRQTVTCHVNIDILLQESLAHMQCVIDMKIISSKCTCGALAETSVTYSKHIIIDTSMFTHKTYIQQDTKYSLNSIAKTVTLNNIKLRSDRISELYTTQRTLHSLSICRHTLVRMI